MTKWQARPSSGLSQSLGRGKGGKRWRRVGGEEREEREGKGKKGEDRKGEGRERKGRRKRKR